MYVHVQVQVYSEQRMDSPLVTSGVDSIGFFELSPLPSRSEVSKRIIIIKRVNMMKLWWDSLIEGLSHYTGYKSAITFLSVYSS